MTLDLTWCIVNWTETDLGVGMRKALREVLNLALFNHLASETT
jgi:hypothetical protein